MGIFGVKTENNTVETVEEVKVDIVEVDKEPVQESTHTLTQDDIAKLVEEQVNAKLSEIIPKAKKEKEEELNAKIEEYDSLIAQTKQEQEKTAISSLLDQNVAPEYKEFVQFQVQQGAELETFLSANPQYKKKVVTPLANTEVVEQEITILDGMKAVAKKKGFIPR